MLYFLKKLNTNNLKKIGQKGQTSVEYILLVAVVVVIMQSIFTQLNDLILNDTDSIQNRYLNSYKEIFSGDSSNGSKNFKRFQIVR